MWKRLQIANVAILMSIFLLKHKQMRNVDCALWLAMKTGLTEIHGYHDTF